MVTAARADVGTYVHGVCVVVCGGGHADGVRMGRVHSQPGKVVLVTRVRRLKEAVGADDRRNRTSDRCDPEKVKRTAISILGGKCRDSTVVGTSVAEELDYQRIILHQIHL